MIELLVVIAIIALLVSILVPSLKKARDLARTVVCISNMKAIGIALQGYVAENNGYMPPPTVAGISSEMAAYVDEAAGEAGSALGGGNWAVSIWPFYGALRLFQCPSDPEANCTSLDRTWETNPVHGPDPVPAYEAFVGAPRQSYYANVGVWPTAWGWGWIPAQWTAQQISVMRPGWVPTTVLRVSSVHGVPPGGLVWVGDLGGVRTKWSIANWAGDPHSANWGCSYGTIGGGRTLSPNWPLVGDPNYLNLSAATWETHPRAADGGLWGWDSEDGGSNYLFMDGHAENRMDMPSLSEMGCAAN